MTCVEQGALYLQRDCVMSFVTCYNKWHSNSLKVIGICTIW